MNENEAFEALAPFVREQIFKAGWKNLRPVQIDAIDAILNTEDDLIIMSPTASGKTEAAFLPILTKIANDATGSVKVLYVAPLKALVNDQFRRLELICEAGEIPVYRWHGDVPAGQKKKLVSDPGGILQITPESLESILHNRSEHLLKMFGGLQFIIVDEVHCFYSADRGVQLGSSLSRLEQYCVAPPRRIALSATVGDVHLAQKWLKPENAEAVRVVNGDAGVDPKFLYRHDNLTWPVAQGYHEGIPPAVVDAIYDRTAGQWGIVFCNRREQVEKLTRELNKKTQAGGRIASYFAHHSSLSKNEREWVENRMKENGRPAVVIATATLELGIDIGNLDVVVQLDDAPTVTGLTQRKGRSGRSSKPQTLYAVTTDRTPTHENGVDLPFGFLHQAAVADLMIRDKWVEPPEPPQAAIHVLFQQILLLLAEKGGMKTDAVIAQVMRSKRWPQLKDKAVAELIRVMREGEYIDANTRGDLVPGKKIEPQLDHYDFLAMFQTQPEYHVRTIDGRPLGQLNGCKFFRAGRTTILLAGLPWQVAEIDHRKRSVIVEQAPEGTPPRWPGEGGAPVHLRVAQRTRDILLGEIEPLGLGEESRILLNNARGLATRVGMRTQSWFGNARQGVFFPWASSKTVSSLISRLEAVGVHAEPVGFPWIVRIPGFNQELQARVQEARNLTPLQLIERTRLLRALCESTYRGVKYAEFLPEPALQWRWLVDEYDSHGSDRLLDQMAAELQRCQLQEVEFHRQGLQVAPGHEI